MKIIFHISRLRLIVVAALFIGCCAFFTVQNWTTIEKPVFDKAMDGMDAFYTKNKKFSENIKHSSFRGWDAIVPYEESKGYYRCENANYHSFIAGIHTIQDDKIRLAIDTAQKSILITNPIKMSGDEAGQISYRNSLNEATAFKSAPSANGTSYKVEFNGKPMYAAYAIDIAQGGQLRSMSVFYRDEYLTDPSNTSSPKAKPRLDITISDFTLTPSFDSKKEFNTGKYVKLVNNKPELTAAYKNYQLTDARINR